MTKKCQGEKLVPGRKDKSLPQNHQLHCIPDSCRNVILTQSDTWKMTVGHMRTSKHLCNYWCWSLRYWLGNLYCVKLLVPLGRGGKSRLLQPCQFVLGSVRGRITQEKWKGGWVVGAPLTKGKLSSHLIALIQIELQLHQAGEYCYYFHTFTALGIVLTNRFKAIKIYKYRWRFLCTSYWFKCQLSIFLY